MHSLGNQKIACPMCREAANESTKNSEFQKRFYSKFGNEYELLSEYKSKDEKIKIKHGACGKVTERLPSFMYRNSAPCQHEECKHAKPEVAISIQDYSDNVNGSIIPKDNIDGKYVKTIYSEFESLEKCYCCKGHAYHVPVNYEYEKLICPFCKVLDSEGYKRLEKEMSVKLVHEKFLNRLNPNIEKRSA